MPVRHGFRRAHLAGALFVVLAGIVAHAGSLQGAFVYDDKGSIVDNPHVRALWPPGQVLTGPPGSGTSGRPLAALSLALNYALGGLEPLGYHLVNLALHLAAALLAWSFLGATAAYAGWPRGVPLAIAVLWVVHPLHTAALDHVVYRNETLAALFVLAVMTLVARAPERASWRWVLGATVAAWLGVASKEVAGVAPLLALAYDRIVCGRSGSTLRHRWRLHAGIASSWVLLAFLVATADRGRSVGLQVGDVGPFEYARTQLAVVAHYLRLVFWPHPLVLDYRWPIATGWHAVFPAAAVTIAALGATVVGLRRAPRWAYWGFWFFVVLAPTSSFLPLTGAVAAEHRMVLPLLGVLAAVVPAAARGLQRMLPGRAASRFGVASVVLATLVLGMVSERRHRDFRSEETIWRDTLAKRPENARACNNLGSVLAVQGRIEEAVRWYRRALEIDPAYSGAHDNLGSALVRQGDLDAAAREFETALRLDPDNYEAHVNLASLLTRAGRLDEAEEHLRRAAALQPEYGMTWYNWGHLYRARGDAAAARAAWERAATLLPRFAPVRHNLAMSSLRAGDERAARRYLEAALQCDPRHAGALNNLAWLLATARDDRVRDGARAVEIAQRALQAAGAPTPGLLDTEAAAWAAAGDFERAVDVATRALQEARQAGDGALAERIASRLAAYREGRAYRMP